MRRAAAILVLACLALAPAASAAEKPVVWSSLPQHGPDARLAGDILRAQRLALAEVADPPFVLRAVADSTRAAAGWAPEKVAENARRAAQDERTLAYLGEFNSGATAITAPILNEGGIPEITPSSTYAGLTRRLGGTNGEPDKYWPTGRPNLVRAVASDHLLGVALAEVAGGPLALVGDDEPYGDSVTALAAEAARRRGQRVVLRARWRRDRDARALARRVARSGAAALVFVGLPANRGDRLLRAVHAAAPKLPLVLTDGTFDTRFARRLESARGVASFVSSTVPPAEYGPAGAAFAEAFRRRYGRAPTAFAINGYESVRLLLDALARAGRAERRALTDALFATPEHDSAIGRYAIDEHGDLTRGRFGIFAARGLRFVRSVEVG